MEEKTFRIKLCYRCGGQHLNDVTYRIDHTNIYEPLKIVRYSCPCGYRYIYSPREAGGYSATNKSTSSNRRKNNQLSLL